MLRFLCEHRKRLYECPIQFLAIHVHPNHRAQHGRVFMQSLPPMLVPADELIEHLPIGLWNTVDVRSKQRTAELLERAPPIDDLTREGGWYLAKESDRSPIFPRVLALLSKFGQVLLSGLPHVLHLLRLCPL